MKVEMSFHNRYYPWTKLRLMAYVWLKGTFSKRTDYLRVPMSVRPLSSALEDSQIDQ